jgi:hypothetical protein
MLGAHHEAPLSDIRTALELGRANLFFFFFEGRVQLTRHEGYRIELRARRQATVEIAKNPGMVCQMEAAGLESDSREDSALQGFRSANFEREKAAANRIGRIEECIVTFRLKVLRRQRPGQISAIRAKLEPAPLHTGAPCPITCLG